MEVEVDIVPHREGCTLHTSAGESIALNLLDGSPAVKRCKNGKGIAEDSFLFLKIGDKAPLFSELFSHLERDCILQAVGCNGFNADFSVSSTRRRDWSM